MSSALVIFAREPRPGTVKTRLARSIGAGVAAAVYGCLLEHTIRIAVQSGLKPRLSLADDPDPVWAAGLGVSFEVQSEGDLGDRMADCFHRHFCLGAETTVIIGSDNANLRPEHIGSAFAALEDHPVVLGPADDGGYWLVGQRAPGVDLFAEIPWSSPETLEATRRRLRSLATPWRELESLPDIDTLTDLRRAIEDPRVDRELRRRLGARQQSVTPPSPEER